MGYPKQVYDRVWEELSRRRRSSREQILSRREEVLRRIPQIVELEREMAAQAASITRAIISSPQNAAARVEALARQNLATQEKRAALLANEGYPADYLTEHHICPACKDTGFTGPKMCSCMETLLRREASAQLSRVSPVGGCGFESFSPDYYSDQPDESGVPPRTRMRDVLAYCKRWADGFSPRSESLLLMGKTGLGKTHLSIAMASAVTDSGYGVLYTPVQRMMDALEAEKFSRDAETKSQYAGVTAAYLDCDLLVLDDLGTEFSTQFTNAALFNVLNTRLSEERPTVVNTNLEPGEIEARYSQRMVSRLICGYQVLRFTGKDIRYIKKLGK